MKFLKKFKIDENVALKILEYSIPKLEAIEFTEDNLHATIVKIAEELEVKSGAVYTVLRIAISSCNVTPGGIVEIADILGKDESMRRFNKALEWLKE